VRYEKGDLRSATTAIRTGAGCKTLTAQIAVPICSGILSQFSHLPSQIR
jgi:hypothetical protein